MTTRTEAEHVCEREHEFTLVLGGIPELTDEVADALFAGGCDDATASTRGGVFYLTFTRPAATVKDAVLSAIRDVRRSDIPGVHVLRLDMCDLVTLAEIGRRIRRSRQMVHQYATGKRPPAGFPSPVCQITEGTPLYLWCDVAGWARRNSLLKEEDLLDARQLSTINSALQWRAFRNDDPDLVEELARIFDLDAQSESRPASPATS